METRFIHDKDHPVVAKPPKPLPPGANTEACKLLFGGIAKMKEEYIGNKPHICKSIPHQTRADQPNCS